VSRQKRTVRQLAAESGRDVEDVLIALAIGGLDVSSTGSIIPPSKAAAARRLLGMSRPKGRRSSSERLEASSLLQTSETGSRMVDVHQEETPDGQPLPGCSAEASSEVKRKTTAKPKTGEWYWRTIGPPQRAALLTARDVERIHWQIVKDFAADRDPIDPPGIRSNDLLESAVFRPQTSLGEVDKYPTVAMAGAGMFHAIVHNHPFHNGNKRTALVALIAFLDLNGWVVTASTDDFFAYVIKLAEHKLIPDEATSDGLYSDKETQAVAQWLQQNMRQVHKGERTLNYAQLKRILREYGCEFDVKPGNKLDIRCRDKKTQVAYPDDGTDVPQSTVHKIRKDLDLDEEHGFDSRIFYDRMEKIPAFIAKYRKILERLALYDRELTPGP
jgi:death-on-curing family protein